MLKKLIYKILCKNGIHCFISNSEKKDILSVNGKAYYSLNDSWNEDWFCVLNNSVIKMNIVKEECKYCKTVKSNSVFIEIKGE